MLRALIERQVNYEDFILKNLWANFDQPHEGVLSLVFGPAKRLFTNPWPVAAAAVGTIATGVVIRGTNQVVDSKITSKAVKALTTLGNDDPAVIAQAKNDLIVSANATQISFGNLAGKDPSSLQQSWPVVLADFRKSFQNFQSFAEKSPTNNITLKLDNLSSFGDKLTNLYHQFTFADNQQRELTTELIAANPTGKAAPSEKINRLQDQIKTFTSDLKNQRVALAQGLARNMILELLDTKGDLTKTLNSRSSKFWEMVNQVPDEFLTELQLQTNILQSDLMSYANGNKTLDYGDAFAKNIAQSINVDAIRDATQQMAKGAAPVDAPKTTN